MSKQQESPKRTTNAKLIPHIPLPFKEVMADVLKPPEKEPKRKASGSEMRSGRKRR